MTNSFFPTSSRRHLKIDQDTVRDLVSNGSPDQFGGLFSVARHVLAHGGTFSIVPDPEVGGDVQSFIHAADLEEYIAELNMGRRQIGASEIPPRGATSGD